MWICECVRERTKRREKIIKEKKYKYYDFTSLCERLGRDQNIFTKCCSMFLTFFFFSFLNSTSVFLQLKKTFVSGYLSCQMGKKRKGWKEEKGRKSLVNISRQKYISNSFFCCFIEIIFFFERCNIPSVTRNYKNIMFIF